MECLGDLTLAYSWEHESCTFLSGNIKPSNAGYSHFLSSKLSGFWQWVPGFLPFICISNTEYVSEKSVRGNRHISRCENSSINTGSLWECPLISQETIAGSARTNAGSCRWLQSNNVCKDTAQCLEGWQNPTTSETASQIWAERPTLDHMSVSASWDVFQNPSILFGVTVKKVTLHIFASIHVSWLSHSLACLTE